LGPGIEEGGLDDFHDVDGRREVSAEGVAFGWSMECGRGCRRCRGDFGPILFGGLAEVGEFGVGEGDAGGFRRRGRR